jgi:hypothetical protein
MFEVNNLSSNPVLFVIPCQVRRDAPLLSSSSVASDKVPPVGIVEVHHNGHLLTFVLALHSLV